MKYEKIIFITGFPRSGTTLLQRLISGGENHDFFPESNAISQLVRAFRAANNLSDDRIAAYFGTIRSVKEFYLDTAGRLIDILLACSDIKKFLVLKDPLMLDVALTALDLFETSKLVMTIRDPLDVLASRTEVRLKMGGQFSFEQLVEKTRAESKYIFGIAREAKIRQNIYLCRYESLCAHPEYTLRVLADQIGFRAKCWQAGKVNIGSPFITKLTKKPVSAESIGRHFKTLNENELAYARDSLSETIKSIQGIVCINDRPEKM